MVGRRIREARLRAGLSQKQLGIKAGIDEFVASPRVNQYERGKHAPDFSTAERLAKVLGVPVPYLYAREDHLADWILAFRELTPQGRMSILGRGKLRYSKQTSNLHFRSKRP